MDFKICTYCGRLLKRTPDYFHRDRWSNDGLTSRCKDCRCMLERKRRQKEKERMSK